MATLRENPQDRSYPTLPGESQQALLWNPPKGMRVSPSASSPSFDNAAFRSLSGGDLWGSPARSQGKRLVTASSDMGVSIGMQDEFARYAHQSTQPHGKQQQQQQQQQRQQQHAGRQQQQNQHADRQQQNAGLNCKSTTNTPPHPPSSPSQHH